MPSYDYNCKSCGNSFTITKSMNDSSTPNCPSCKSSDVARIWGGIQLKGCCSSSSSSGGCGSCNGGSCGSCH